jgi:hypothetical protein
MTGPFEIWWDVQDVFYLNLPTPGTDLIRRWLAAEMGRLGGAVTTKAKAVAARRNGKLGGRPRKSKIERKTTRQ